MERIVISKLDLKPSGMLVVGIEGKKDATMNMKWQDQEIDFLQKDVGIGGSCEVQITQKGQYTNITAVNMDEGSYNKGKVVQSNIQPQKKVEDSNVQRSIEAQTMTKMVMEIMLSQGSMDMSAMENIADSVIKTFKYIKSKN